VLEECLAALDGAKHGLVFASGLATMTTIVHLLDAGDHIVCMDDLYGGTNRYFRKVASRMNLSVDFVDATDSNKVKAVMKPNTKMVKMCKISIRTGVKFIITLAITLL
jgi:cystathionine gamma-lyase